MLIGGVVRGDIVAGEKIEILCPAKVFGNIEAPIMTVEVRGHLRGELYDPNHHRPSGQHSGISEESTGCKKRGVRVKKV